MSRPQRSQQGDKEKSVVQQNSLWHPPRTTTELTLVGTLVPSSLPQCCVLCSVFVICTYVLFLDIFIHKSNLYKLQLVGIECPSEKGVDNCLFHRLTKAFFWGDSSWCFQELLCTTHSRVYYLSQVKRLSIRKVAEMCQFSIGSVWRISNEKRSEAKAVGWEHVLNQDPNVSWAIDKRDSWWDVLRGSDCKYWELVERLKKSEILITCQKNTFGELSSKTLFQLSGTPLFSGNSEKTV